MRVACIADEDTVRGFSLAGVAGHKVTSPAEAAEALRHVLAEPDIGLIILTSQAAAGIRNEVEAVRLGRDRPLIAEIPGPSGTLPLQRDLRHSVEEAIGIHLEFQEDT